MTRLKMYKKQILRGLLAAAVVASLSFASLGSSKAMDLTKDCSLTVNLVENEDVKEAGVVYDLYQVATVTDISKSGQVTFAAAEALAGMQDGIDQMNGGDREQVTALGQLLAREILLEKASVTKVVEAQSVDQALTGLNAGLYLVVAHGRDMEKYVTEISDKEGNVVVATLAETKLKTYQFMPQLVMLPGQTEESSDFQFEVSMSLKSEFVDKFGSLEIRKKLLTYETSENANFVFQIEAYNDETKAQKVYSNVVAMSFDDANENALLIENEIPIGAYTEVTEVYSGAKYVLVSDQTVSVVIPAEGNGIVEFTNDYDESQKGGGAVVNKFSYDEKTGWNWEQE